MRKAALILGAGFSFAGNLPLTRDLFDPAAPLPKAPFKAAGKFYKQVTRAFEIAKTKTPNLTAEPWLEELYAERKNILQEMLFHTRWDRAIRYALARLVELPKGSNSHYYYGIGNYKCSPVHKRFWEHVERQFDLKYIVTLNYDILVEQALHTDTTKHRTAPRCRYGGFQHVQAVRKMKDVVKRDYELMELGDEFVLYKLHGSVNWAWEPHSPTVKIHQDVRAVFRVDDEHGIPAIIPPIPEKELPKDFSQVWNEAKKVLSTTPTWIVCGYSLPSYDRAVRSYFQKILESRASTEIIVIDPNSKAVAARWKSLSKGCSTISLPGLPEALGHSWS